jgi:putative two-component system response regulator
MTDTTKQPRILIVDDEEKNFRLITAILKNLECLFETAKNGKEAVLKTVTFSPDLIFLDIMMPEMDGYTVCKLLKDNPDTRHIPIIIVSALDDKTSKLKVLEAGANDFLIKPIDSTEVIIRTKNLLRIKEFEDFLKDHAERLAVETEKKTADLNAALQDITRAQRSLKASYLDTIFRLTIVAEFKDEATVQHVKRVGLCCAHIAKELGWSEEQVETIKYASPMHDIGKIGIPSDILLKPAALSPEELALVKTHTLIGGKILHGSRSAFLQMAEKIAINHHERWDGTGYPGELKREEIPVEGRITAFADQYDALRSLRPYKPPFDYVMAYRIMLEGNERMGPHHFDPRLLEIFKDTHKSFEKIYEHYKDAPTSMI